MNVFRVVFPRVFQWSSSCARHCKPSGNQWKPSGIQCLKPVVTSTNLNNSELELHRPVLVMPLGLRAEVRIEVAGASGVPIVINGQLGNWMTQFS
jgi:hypothetical protein